MTLPTLIIRHKKENLKKCSLRGLEQDPSFKFYTYPLKETLSTDNYVLLTMGAKELSTEDAHLGLILVDATWKLAGEMIHKLELEKKCIPRSLPSHFRTAYPRKQTLCPDPLTGLASIEALFLAYHLLGKKNTHLLDLYHWKEDFLHMNQLQ